MVSFILCVHVLIASVYFIFHLTGIEIQTFLTSFPVKPFFFFDLFYFRFRHLLLFSLPLIDFSFPKGAKLQSSFRIQKLLQLRFFFLCPKSLLSVFRLPFPIPVFHRPLQFSLLQSAAAVNGRHLFPTWPPLKLCSWQFLRRVSAPMFYARYMWRQGQIHSDTYVTENAEIKRLRRNILFL